MYTHFYRTGLALSEYNFTFNFCRVVIEKFGFELWLRYGTHTVRKQVRCSYCEHKFPIYKPFGKIKYILRIEVLIFFSLYHVVKTTTIVVRSGF